MTMLIAGMVLIIAGYLKLGTYIKYIPYPVVVGFTAGIGLLLISTQVKDLLGLQIDNVPAEILPKWNVYIHNFDKLSWSSVVISVFTFAAIFYTQFKKPKLPAYLISVVGATLIVAVFGLDIATIGNKFGGIPHFLPMPQVPDFDWNLFFKVMPSGLTIAFLAGIESLLSATVVDGMSGDNHNSNAELVGRALPTLPVSSSWGFPLPAPLPAPPPISKPVHLPRLPALCSRSFCCSLCCCCLPAAKYIPLACLSAVLIIVGWNMMNVEKIYKLLLGREATVIRC